MDDLQRGQSALDAADYHEALETFTRLIAAEPRNVNAYRGRSLAHQYLHNRPAAIADLNTAIKIAPRDSSLKFERAKLLFAQHQYTAAVEDLGDEPEHLTLRGLCHAALGNSVQALKDFDAAGATELAARLRDIIPQ